MSLGIGAHANIVLENEHTVIYEYGGYNLNDPKFRNENRVYDGKIVISKEFFVEPNFRLEQEKRHMIPCIFIEKEGSDYGVSRSFESMLKNPDFVLYQKYTYEDAQKFLHAKEQGIDVHLFVRKNKEEKT